MPFDTLPEESEIVQQLAQGREAALRYFYDKYSNRIYLLSMKFLKSPEQAQELVQDVFLKLWEKRAELDKDRPVEAWLYTVAKNRVINNFKKMAREQSRIVARVLPLELADRRQGSDTKVLESEVNQLLYEAMCQLPEKQKEVYRLSRLEGYSRIEIAEQLQISSLTVKTHMSRAVLSIKNFVRSKGLSAGCLSLGLLFF